MLLSHPNRLSALSIPVSTGWLLGACMEAKGKQDLWLQQKPEILKALRKQAIIQSAESSNRIEGVTVKADRLRPIVLGRSKPRDRSEEEVAGYRKALNWIFTSKRPIPVVPETILKLHALSQGGSSGDAGSWKQRDNEIIEILPNGERRVRFKPTSAKKTAKAMEQLCLAYTHILDNERLPVLLTVASFVFDFLCVHPFRDGNGRISRLLTTLLLGHHGFSVCRYISLERLIEESKQDYYEILGKSSVGWHEGEHDIVPWWNYFLSTLNRAYREFALQVESSDGRSGKSDLVRQVILRQVGAFTLAELRSHCPQVSIQLIKKILSHMKKDGFLKLSGRGRGARWNVVKKA